MSVSTSQTSPTSQASQTRAIDWRSLSANQAFQSALETDPELLRLDAARRNPDDDRHELIHFLGGVIVLTVGKLEIPLAPVTAGQVMVLALLKSPLLMNGMATGWQIETALYVLIKGKKAALLSPEYLQLSAHQYLAAAGNIDYEQTGSDVRFLLHLADLPYTMLPRSSDSSVQSVSSVESMFSLYSADWLSGLVARVSGVTNLQPDQIIWELPMSAAAAYDIQYRRLVLHQANICRRSTNVEAVEGYHNRLHELAVEFSAAPSVKSVKSVEVSK